MAMDYLIERMENGTLRKAPLIRYATALQEDTIYVLIGTDLATLESFKVASNVKIERVEYPGRLSAQPDPVKAEAREFMALLGWNQAKHPDPQVIKFIL